MLRSLFHGRPLSSVGGRDLGAPVFGYLGKYWQCCSEDTESLEFPQPERQMTAAQVRFRMERPWVLPGEW